MIGQGLVELVDLLVELVLDILDAGLHERAFAGDRLLVVVELLLHLRSGLVVALGGFGDFGKPGLLDPDRRLGRRCFLAEGCDFGLFVLQIRLQLVQARCAGHQ